MVAGANRRPFGVSGSRLAAMLLLVIAAFVVCSSAQKDPERKVLYRLEYIDIEKVLDNQRMLTAFIRCFMRLGPCTPEARDFRKLLPKLAVSMCADCTPRQRYIIKKVFGHLMEHRPKEWEQLLDRFDPQRKYADRLQHFMSGDFYINSKTTTTTARATTFSIASTTTDSPTAESSSLRPEPVTKTELPPYLVRADAVALPLPVAVPTKSKSKFLKKVDSQSKYDALKSAEILNSLNANKSEGSS